MAGEGSGKTTKQRIFEAAIHLFSERGFHGTSVRDLARSVGIKESSIYNHFKSKGEILETILDYQLQGIRSALFTRDEMDERSQIESDPVRLWLDGTEEYMRRLPPLSSRITVILYNEMYLNHRCRLFVLNTLLPAQKDITEVLLTDLQNKQLIKKCDIPATAAQYVYFVHGMTIENTLRQMESSDPKRTDAFFHEQIALFIGRLKK